MSDRAPSPSSAPTGTCNLNGDLHKQTCGCIDWRPSSAPTGPTRYETRALYPKLYQGALGKNGMLLHTAEVNDAGDVLAVLCGKVKPENVDEVALMEGHEGDPPDCPMCLRRDPRFAAASPPSPAPTAEPTACCERKAITWADVPPRSHRVTIDPASRNPAGVVVAVCSDRAGHAGDHNDPALWYSWAAASPPFPALTDEWETLMKLAKAATPGPWRTVTNRPFGPWADKDCEPLAADSRPVLVRNWKEACLNAAFIAACSPERIVALLTALRSSASALAEAERELSETTLLLQKVTAALNTALDDETQALFHYQAGYTAGYSHGRRQEPQRGEESARAFVAPRAALAPGHPEVDR